MAFKNPGTHYSSVNVDCLVSSNYIIFKNNLNNPFLPMSCFFSLTNVNNLINPPVLSVGTDSPVFSNFILPTTVTTLSALNNVFPVFPDYVYFVISPGEELRILVNTIANATTYDVTATITGVYL